MDYRIGLGIITDANVGIEPNTSSGAQRIVEMNEAAFRGFDMVTSKGIWDASKLETVHSIKRFGVESH